jgi:outer membrane biosynthesis protein TonB
MSLINIKCRCGATSISFQKNIGPFYIDECCTKAGYDHLGNKAEGTTEVETQPTTPPQDPPTENSPYQTAPTEPTPTEPTVTEPTVTQAPEETKQERKAREKAEKKAAAEAKKLSEQL